MGVRVWHTLAHKGPLFPSAGVAVKNTGKDAGNASSCDVGLMDVPHDAKVAVKRMMATVERKSSFKSVSAFEDRFWKSWFKEYAPSKALKCSSARPTADQARRLTGQQSVEQTQKPLKAVHGYDTACVDGEEKRIANYKVELPGVFAGRGHDHPFAGRVKRALRSSNVTLNLGKNAKVQPPSDGGEWAGVVHDDTASWLASWSDPATGKRKYMRLADRTREDTGKFELAQRVLRVLPLVRTHVTTLVARAAQEKDIVGLQMGCCLLLIDRFALRVGGEAGGRAGRVFGATTLRREHVTMSASGSRLALAFVGKDSVLCVAEGEVSKELFMGMSLLLSAQKARGNVAGVFDDIEEKALNRFIVGHMGFDATAKTIRTARACDTYEQALLAGSRHEGKEPWRWQALEKLAVVGVAMLCNHRRAQTGQPDPKREEKVLEAAFSLVSRSRDRKSVREVVLAASEGMNLSTAPGNYLDPRITRAFEARHGLPTGTCSTPTLRRKFAWADGTPVGFRFSFKDRSLHSKSTRSKDVKRQPRHPAP